MEGGKKPVLCSLILPSSVRFIDPSPHLWSPPWGLVMERKKEQGMYGKKERCAPSLALSAQEREGLVTWYNLVGIMPKMSHYGEMPGYRPGRSSVRAFGTVRWQLMTAAKAAA